MTEKKYPKVIVGAFILNNNNELLLLKGKKWHNKYVCVGGKVEYGEKLKKALEREIKEETGLKIKDLKFLGVSEATDLGKSYQNKDKHLIFIDYLGKTDEVLNLKLNDEHSDYKWLKVEDWLKKKKEKFAPKVYESIKKILDLKKEEDYQGKYLRALADYENLKKEMEKQKQEWISFANSNLITEILPVLDNFKISTKHIPEKERKSPWVEGIMYIQKQLLDVLKSQGVEEIETVGKKFDHNLHEAVKDNNLSEEEKKKFKEGEIIKEVRPGYKMHEKVIIPAKVVVKSDN